MDITALEQYLNKRNELTMTIARGIMKTISPQIRELSEDPVAVEELGSSILSASNEIAETIMDILSGEEYEEEE